MILGIDPGTYSSGWALYGSGGVYGAGEKPNAEIEVGLEQIDNPNGPSWVGCPDVVAVEMIGHYGTGMSVGAETYHTILWIGRWLKVCELAGVPAVLLRRQSIKAELCGTARAKDKNVAQALRDIFGWPQPPKRNPAGVSGHAWQALAVAVAYSRGVKPIERRSAP